jgi:nickel-type superoxide dismutase maturation protease
MRFFTARVSGPSMVPTLRSGDLILVRRTAVARPGDVVVGRFRSRPDLLVVKRVARREADGWWLTSDNGLTSDDSRSYGTADVVGRVVCRYWPRPRAVMREMGHA